MGHHRQRDVGRSVSRWPWELGAGSSCAAGSGPPSRLREPPDALRVGRRQHGRRHSTSAHTATLAQGESEATPPHHLRPGASPRSDDDVAGSSGLRDATVGSPQGGGACDGSGGGGGSGSGTTRYSPLRMVCMLNARGAPKLSSALDASSYTHECIHMHARTRMHTHAHSCTHIAART